MKIELIEAREIIASGGYPTVEAVVKLDSGALGRASVPYGASAGSHEASVLVDGGERYSGKGMRSVVDSIETKIAPLLLGKDAGDQREIDRIMLELDGTDNKANLGGNAILAVSLAVAKAASAEKGLELFEHIRDVFGITGAVELPNPMMVSIEGGKHAHNSTDFQEYCLLGLGTDGPTENIRRCLEAYHQLQKILEAENFSTNVGNEGAFAPSGMTSNEQPLQFLVRAIEAAGYTPGADIGIAIDPAASEFYKDGKYELAIEGRALTADELIAYCEAWLDKYPLKSVEDLLSEDDWEAWAKFNTIANNKGIYNVGDDLTVTNVKRLQKAIDLNAINAILIKLNQIGSLTETVETCLLARSKGMITIPSHRGGGESNDTAMVDLAAAVGSKWIKVGPTRGERVEKYNRLMEIERKLKP